MKTAHSFNRQLLSNSIRKNKQSTRKRNTLKNVSLVAKMHNIVQNDRFSPSQFVKVH